eukprot:5626431-Amphidinium_carterae.1
MDKRPPLNFHLSCTGHVFISRSHGGPLPYCTGGLLQGVCLRSTQAGGKGWVHRGLLQLADRASAKTQPGGHAGEPRRDVPSFGSTVGYMPGQVGTTAAAGY